MEQSLAPDMLSVGSRRKWVSLTMVIVAAIATIATSPPFSSVEDIVETTPFDLSASNPEVTIPFVFEVSEAARTGNFYADFDFEVVWRGASIPEPELTAEIYNSAGELVASTSADDRLFLNCHAECMGSNELVLRLPEGFTGSATIEWTARAISEWDSNDTPDGAVVFLDIDEPPTMTMTQIVASGHLSAGEPERRIVVRNRIEVTTVNPGTEYYLEVVDSRSQFNHPDAALYAITGETIETLQAAGSIRVSPPDDCGARCTWSFDLMLVDMTLATHNEPYAGWRLRQMDNASPSPVSTTDVEVPTLTASLTGGPIRLEGNQVEQSYVRLKFDDKALAVFERLTVPPHVLLTLEAHVDESTMDFPEDGRFEHGFSEVPPFGEGTGRAIDFPLYDTSINSGRIVAIPAPLDCVFQTCDVDVALDFATERFETGHIDVTWEVHAYLSFPFESELPDLSMTLEERP